MAAVLALLRPTLTLAAVVAAQFDAQLASTWRPSGGLKLQVCPKRRPRGPSGAHEAPRKPEDKPQRHPRDPKLSPRGAPEAPSGAQKAPKMAPRAARRQPKSIWRAQKAMSENKQKVPYCRGKLQVREALGGYVKAKLEPKMESKCTLAAQHGAQVPLDSPTWQYRGPDRQYRGPYGQF